MQRTVCEPAASTTTYEFAVGAAPTATEPGASFFSKIPLVFDKM